MSNIGQGKTSIIQIKHELKESLAILEEIAPKNSESVVIQNILNQSVQKLNAEKGIIFLMDLERTTTLNEMVVRYVYNLNEDIKDNLMALLELGIIGKAAEQETPTIENNRDVLEKDPIILQLILPYFEVRSCLCLPIKLPRKILGVLCILNKNNSGFTEKDKTLAAPLSVVLSAVIFQLHPIQEIQEHYEKIVHELGRVGEGSNNYNEGRSIKVAQYAELILNEFIEEPLIPQDDKDYIQMVAKLYDIGKILIPEEILNKREELTPEDWKVIEKHSANGYDILKSFDTLKLLLPLIRWHHQKPDGGGYPDNLTGKDIPLLVRIFTVADAYHAMTSDRSHRDKMSQEEAIKELTREAGTKFDPEVVRRFITVLPKVS